MSRVIKNNDGVAVVEGTPASSLIKDSGRFLILVDLVLEWLVKILDLDK